MKNQTKKIIALLESKTEHPFIKAYKFEQKPHSPKQENQMNRDLLQQALDALKELKLTQSMKIPMAIAAIEKELSKPENPLDAIDRAYFEGKKAGIAEANAVNEVAKTEQKDNFCNACGKFMPEGGIHTCSPQVKQQFYPDWDMVKPLQDRIAELEAQLHGLGKGCSECGKKESDGWALYCVECVEKASKPEQEPVAWVIPGAITQDKKLAEANGANSIPLYTSPPRKEWVGLDVDDIDAIQVNVFGAGLGLEITKFARAIEAKLKEKNT
jgi:hypothetical protein